MHIQTQTKILTFSVAILIVIAGCFIFTKNVSAETRFDFLDIQEGETRTLNKAGSPYITLLVQEH